MATYAALRTLARNVEDHMHGDLRGQDLKPLSENVVKLQKIVENCPQATLTQEFEVTLRDYAYRAANAIEIHFWHLHRRDEGGCFSILTSFFGLILTWMYSRSVNDKLHELNDEAACLVVEAQNLRDGVTNHPPIMQSSSSSSSSVYTPEGETRKVLLDSDIGKLEERLYEGCRQRQVIPIVGMGGSGKTTLANFLFHDRRTVKRFDRYAWITASQNYDKCALLSQILSDLKERLPENLEDEPYSKLGLKVYQTLKYWRYLIVIDNVWSEQLWSEIKSFLPDEQKSSRILLTTRDDNVADYVVDFNSESYIHKVEMMNSDKSWSLLKETVFGQEQACPVELETIGKSIANGCGGHPLAIILIAEALSCAKTEKDLWEKIASDVRNVISTNLSDKVLEILSLSYINLPVYLKPCFLYMACFPKDYDIEVSKLIILWIAEGFLKPNDSKRSEEELAYEYLEALVKKNLVLVSKTKYDGKIELCRLHDLIRHMCVGMAEKENFVFQIHCGWKLSSTEIKNKIRFSICSLDFVIEYRYLPNGQIRSTHYFPIGRQPDSYREVLVSSWPKFLQVLNAGDIVLAEFPYQVCQLYLLKYLALSIRKEDKKGTDSYVEEVPSSIIKLRNLQVFRAEGSTTGLTIKLPLEIWKMPKLRHLTFLCKTIIPDPPIGTASSPLQRLQTLRSLVDFKFTKQVLRMIPNVKVLDIEYKDGRSGDYCLENLVHLENLETLTIRAGFPIGIIPLPPNLKNLALFRCGFPWSKIDEVAGSLPSLEVMKLKGNKCGEDEWEIKGEFPQLKVLEIDETDLIFWKHDDEERRIFPNLEHLYLYNCRYLKELPLCMGEIPTLKLIEVDMSSKSLVKWARDVRDVQEDYGNEFPEICILGELRVKKVRETPDLPDDASSPLESRPRSFKGKEITRQTFLDCDVEK